MERDLKNIKTLMQLIEEHPDLPVLIEDLRYPETDRAGRIVMVHLDSYYESETGGGTVFQSTPFWEDILEECADMSEEQIAAIEWQPAIVVCIDFA